MLAYANKLSSDNTGEPDQGVDCQFNGGAQVACITDDIIEAQSNRVFAFVTPTETRQEMDMARSPKDLQLDATPDVYPVADIQSFVTSDSSDDRTGSFLLCPSLTPSRSDGFQVCETKEELCLSPSMLENSSVGFKPFGSRGPASDFTLFNENKSSGINLENLTTSPKETAQNFHASESSIGSFGLTDLSDCSAFAEIDNAHNLSMNIYSTPGPIFCAPPAVYFESPTEDPSVSSPIKPFYRCTEADTEFMPTNKMLFAEDDLELNAESMARDQLISGTCHPCTPKKSAHLTQMIVHNIDQPSTPQRSQKSSLSEIASPCMRLSQLIETI